MTLARDMWLGLALGLLTYNALVAAVFVLDKALAKRGSRRISERTLLALAACFGAPGALFAMRSVRHKTQKLRFRIGVPIMVALQLSALGAWLWLR